MRLISIILEGTKKGMQLSGLMSDVIINVISLDMTIMKTGAYSLFINEYLDSIVCVYVTPPPFKGKV